MQPLSANREVLRSPSPAADWLILTHITSNKQFNVTLCKRLSLSYLFDVSGELCTWFRENYNLLTACCYGNNYQNVSKLDPVQSSSVRMLPAFFACDPVQT